MAGGTGSVLFAVVLLASVAVTLGGETCTTREYHSWLGRDRYSTTYCTYDCCGYWPDQYCCSVNAGAIVGIIIAVIAGICILVAVICCCIKKQGAPGRVVAPQGGYGGNGANVTVVTTNASGQYAAGGYTQPMPMQPMQPPPYNTAGAPPPAYNYGNGAPAAGTSNPFAEAAYNSKS